ncbi:hypothetical protein BSL78_15787 [Apostichopus japonicus]|uniref:Ig-like domain-containing protein n=1 Tax=Stichopus japonicus TaxID=307972 RepID=A0A2G8KH62_STIJA|nr:hypothetical protein BSL78_15787 [Apostichopus japonicus]
MKERKTGKMDVFHTLLRLLVWFVFTKESVSSCDHTNPRSNYVIAFVNEIKSSCCFVPYLKRKRAYCGTRTDENETILFRDDIRRFNEREHSINVNDDHCHIQNYSLKLSNMPANDSNGQYTCWYNGSVVTTFCVLLQGYIHAILADQGASVTINVVEPTENRPMLTHFIEFLRNLFAAVIALGIFCVGIAVGKRICKKTTEPSAAVSSAVERGWSRLSSRISERTRRRYNRCVVDVSRWYNTLSRPPAIPSNNALEAARAVCLSPDTSATGASSSREDPTYIDIYEMVDKGAQNGSPRDASN